MKVIVGPHRLKCDFFFFFFFVCVCVYVFLLFFLGGWGRSVGGLGGGGCWGFFCVFFVIVVGGQGR